MNVKVELTEQEAEKIISALGHFPHNQVDVLIKKIQAQAAVSLIQQNGLSGKKVLPMENAVPPNRDGDTCSSRSKNLQNALNNAK